MAIKAKLLPRWPAAIDGVAPIVATKANGAVTLSYDSSSLPQVASPTANGKVVVREGDIYNEVPALNVAFPTIANNTLVGNNSGGTAAPSALTGAQTNVILPAFTGDSGSGGVKGLVPAPSAGDAAAGRYLDSDGTWSVPAGAVSSVAGRTGAITLDGTDVAFTQSGAGATTRNATLKMREMVSIKDFGAVGDGSADDTTAIRDAYAALMAQGGGVLFAPRTASYYRVTDTINFTTANKPFLFKGEGPTASRFKLEAASPRTLFYCGTAVYQDSLKLIEDLSIIAPDTACQGAGYRAIHFVNQGKPVIRHCSIDGGQNQIFIENTFATALHNVTFTNSRSEAVYFVNDKSANGSVISNCSFFANGITNSAPAIYIPNGDGTLILGNDIEGNHSGIFFGGTTALSIIGNYIEVSTNVNIYCIASSYATIIEGNWLGASSAVSLDNMIGGSFTNNSVYNFSVTFGATTQDVDCGNNYLSGTGSVGSVPFKAPGAFTNSWASGADAVGYMKKSNGVVVLRGELTTGTPPSSAFTLPVGYRPSQTMYFATYGGGGVFGSVAIQSSGNVIPQNAPGGTIRLDGISFNV